MPTNTRRAFTRGLAQRGSASIEAAIGLPAFILFIGLIIAAGRTAVAHQAVESAAADAARAASIARTSTEAQRDAEQAAHTSLANQQLNCQQVAVNVDTDGFAAPVGQAAMVDVTVQCLLDLSDLTVPGIPGSHTIESTMSSPLDTYRERHSGAADSERPHGAQTGVGL